MVAIGWSFGDIAAAIKILWHVIEAFDNAKGAKKQYADSCAFLRGLALILQYLESPEGQDLPSNVLSQATTIRRAYEQFDGYLEKHYRLSSTRPNEIRTALGTVRWSLDDLHGKVQKIKDTALDAVAVLETLVVFDLKTRISGLRSSGDRQEALLTTTSANIGEVRDHISTLSQASSDYNQKLSAIQAEGQQQTEEVKVINTRIEDIAKLQIELTESLKKLNEHIEEQQRLHANQADAEKWSHLQVEVQKQDQALEDLKTNHERTQKTLNDTQGLLTGISNVTGDQRLGQLSNKVGGVSQVMGSLGGFSSLGGLFGKKKSSTSTPTRQPSSRTIPPTTVARSPPPRTYSSMHGTIAEDDDYIPPAQRPRKALPPMPTIPPPKRMVGQTSVPIRSPDARQSMVPEAVPALPPRPTAQRRNTDAMVDLPPPLPSRPSQTSTPPAMPPRPVPAATVSSPAVVTAATLPDASPSKPTSPKSPRPALPTKKSSAVAMPTNVATSGPDVRRTSFTSQISTSSASPAKTMGKIISPPCAQTGNDTNIDTSSSTSTVRQRAMNLESNLQLRSPEQQQHRQSPKMTQASPRVF